AWSDQSLTEADVTSVLGVASRKVLYDLAAGVIAGDTAAPLQVIDKLATQGFDISHVARDLLAVLRDVVVTASTDAATELVDLPEEERDSVRQLAQHSLDDLIRLHQGFSQSYDDVVRSGQPRAALEMLLVRLARRPPLVPIDDLIERLMRLEKRLHAGGRGGAGSGGSPRPSGRGAATGQHAPSARSAPLSPDPQRERSALPARRADNESPSSARASAAPPADPTPRHQRVASGDVPPPLNGARLEERTAAPPPSAPAARPSRTSAAVQDESSALRSTLQPTTAATHPSSGARADTAPSEAGQTHARESSTNDEVPDASAHTESDAEPETTTDTADDNTDPTLRSWRNLLDSVRETDPKLAAFLEHAQALEVGAQRISIRYEKASVVEVALQDSTNASTLLDHAEQVL